MCGLTEASQWTLGTERRGSTDLLRCDLDPWLRFSMKEGIPPQERDGEVLEASGPLRTLMNKGTCPQAGVTCLLVLEAADLTVQGVALV